MARVSTVCIAIMCIGIMCIEVVYQNTSVHYSDWQLWLNRYFKDNFAIFVT